MEAGRKGSLRRGEREGAREKKIKFLVKYSPTRTHETSIKHVAHVPFMWKKRKQSCHVLQSKQTLHAYER